jgi:hypothetical protein
VRCGQRVEGAARRVLEDANWIAAAMRVIVEHAK